MQQSRTPLEAEPLEVTELARAAVMDKVAAHPNTAAHLKRVLDLIDGFEGAYDLELLASVHWAASREGATTAAHASRLIRQWNRRKASLFSEDHVTVAWKALQQRHWLREPAAV